MPLLTRKSMLALSSRWLKQYRGVLNDGLKTARRAGDLAGTQSNTHKIEQITELVDGIRNDRELSSDMVEYSDIVFFAFRYAFGRMTYAAHTVSNYIIDNLDSILEHDAITMRKEIRDGIEKGRAGQQVDVMAWKKLAEAIDQKYGK